MSIAACALVLAAALSAGSTRPVVTHATPILPPALPAPSPGAEWRVDAETVARPAALPALYASFAALQAADVYSTRRATAAGATEANPLMKPLGTRTGAVVAVKAAGAAAAIYFAERAWKKNRKGALVLMAVINGVTAGVVAANLKHAGR